MAYTFWEKDFLIMCSYMSQSANCFMHSGFLLHIISNYALQILCGSPHKICNEDGKLDGLPLNRALRDADGDIYDIVAGIFLSSDSANRISQTCRTSLPSGLPSNFGSRKCFCGKVTKSLPRRCRTSRCRAVCHTNSTIENYPTAW